MGTALRGYGWYKWDLLRAIYVEFGPRRFTYSEAAKISGFDRKTFISLVNDGRLVNKKERKGRTFLWRLNVAAVNILSGNGCHEDVPLEPGLKSRAPRRSKRLLLEKELFCKQVQAAIDFFSNSEVTA